MGKKHQTHFFIFSPHQSAILFHLTPKKLMSVEIFDTLPIVVMDYIFDFKNIITPKVLLMFALSSRANYQRALKYVTTMVVKGYGSQVVFRYCSYMDIFQVVNDVMHKDTIEGEWGHVSKQKEVVRSHVVYENIERVHIASFEMYNKYAFQTKENESFVTHFLSYNVGEKTVESVKDASKMGDYMCELIDMHGSGPVFEVLIQNTPLNGKKLKRILFLEYLIKWGCVNVLEKYLKAFTWTGDFAFQDELLICIYNYRAETRSSMHMVSQCVMLKMLDLCFQYGCEAVFTNEILMMYCFLTLAMDLDKQMNETSFVDLILSHKKRVCGESCLLYL